jgi:hypothetical protein
MTSSPIPSIEIADTQHSFVRDILATTTSYMKWGYGALLLSLIAYGYCAAFQRITSGSARLSISLAALATALTLAVAARLWSRRPEIDFRSPQLTRPTPGSPEQRPAPRSR